MNDEKTTINPIASAPQNVNFTFFSIHFPLQQCAESLLVDSGTKIANIAGKTADGLRISVDLMVIGQVSVTYQGMTYNKPSEFPEELRKLIAGRSSEMTDLADMTDEQLDAAMDAFDPSADEIDDDYYVTLNNWFEYVCKVIDADGDIVKADGIFCEDDLHTMSEEQLRSEMEEVVRQILELV